MRIKQLFNINQGHQITDEEIYQDIPNEGATPIITANNEVKGRWTGKIVKTEDLPCITYPSKANGGVCYVQHEIFDANNTAVLIPMEDWRKKIYLEWFAFKLSKIFLKVATSKEGVNYLNKEIVEELDVDFPDKDSQIAQYASISKLLKLKKEIENVLTKIVRIKSSTPTFIYKDFQAKGLAADKIFDCLNGNSGLTEEIIYQNISAESGDKKYLVLSSSTIERTKMGIIPKCKLPHSNKEITVFEGKEGLLVARNGRAGRLQFLESGDYTLNDHAYILYLKDAPPVKLNLKWIIYQYQDLFYEFASKSDNGTWNKTGFFKHAKFDIPSLKEQEKIVNQFEVIENYDKKLTIISKNIENILDKEIF